MAEEQADTVGRRSISDRLTPLVLMGMQAAGYDIVQEHLVRNQRVEQIAQTCAPDDATTQQAIQAYLGQLLALQEKLDQEEIGYLALLEQIRQQGATWYGRALDSAHGAMEPHTARGRLEPEIEPSRHLRPIQHIGVFGPAIPERDLPSSVERVALRIHGNMAPLLADALLSHGYHLALEQIVGKTAGEIAAVCEPDDPARQQNVVNAIFLCREVMLQYWQRQTQPPSHENDPPPEPE